MRDPELEGIHRILSLTRDGLSKAPIGLTTTDREWGYLVKVLSYVWVDQARAQARVVGFTLIEFVIVVASIAIILTIAMPVYTDYTIRAKLKDVLGAATTGQAAVAAACTENPELTGLTNAAVGYDPEASIWVEDIVVSADCRTPIITISTRNTGAPADPRITLTGNLAEDHASIAWLCTTTARNQHAPSTCRR